MKYYQDCLFGPKAPDEWACTIKFAIR